MSPFSAGKGDKGGKGQGKKGERGKGNGKDKEQSTVRMERLNMKPQRLPDCLLKLTKAALLEPIQELGTARSPTTYAKNNSELVQYPPLGG